MLTDGVIQNLGLTAQVAGIGLLLHQSLGNGETQCLIAAYHGPWQRRSHGKHNIVNGLVSLQHFLGAQEEDIVDLELELVLTRDAQGS